MPIAIVSAMVLGALLAYFSARKPTTARDRVVAAAVSQLGQCDPRPYVEDALGYAGGGDTNWCGEFALWCLHRAGLVLDWQWSLDKHNPGFLYRLPVTADPKPGDFAYYAEPYQHHQIVERLYGDGTFDGINGNGNGGCVTRSRGPRSHVSAFYAIDPILSPEVGTLPRGALP
jgi:hypothetical protein